MRRLLVTLIPLALLACDQQPASPAAEVPLVSMDVTVVHPAGVQPLPAPLVPVVINNSPGHQIDPHVNGDIAAYSNQAVGSEIRYYDFGTGADNAIPTAGSNDQLSDVSAGRVVFNRAYGDGSEAVMLFDAASGAAPVEVNPASPIFRSAAAIGANTIAYVDHLLPGDLLNAGEIVAWDLVAGSATRLTNDGNVDQAPAVSPDGNVIVWERCPISLINCDVVQAVKTTSGWTVSDVAATAASEGFPDTNGSIVLWIADTGAGYDIYWRPVAGGATQQLELAGNQVRPAIAGDVISFEGEGSGGTDLFLYHLVDGALYQLTNTPGVNESLNDVTVLPGHIIRVVWQANDGTDGMNDIHGATVAIPHVTLTSYTDRDVFLQNAGTVTEIDFDHDACGAPIAAPSGGMLAGSRYAPLGVTFAAGVIFYDATGATLSPPNEISNAQVNTPTPALVAGTFATPVSAVGISNVGAGAVLRLFDSSGNLITSLNTDADVNTLDFVGVVSSIPVQRFEYDFVSGLGFGGDNLLFSTIAQVSSDCIPPTTTASVTPSANAAGWNATAVAVTLSSADNTGGSGVMEVAYELSGAASAPPVSTQGSAATLAISAEGITTVVYHAVDNAGNLESPKTLVVRIDATPPVLSLPAPVTTNATSPSGANVSYTVTATDNLDPAAGVSCTPGSGTLVPIGTTVVSCAATDAAGNTASGSFTVTVVGAAGQITDLVTQVSDFNLRQGIENSLDAKLSAVQSALAAAQGGDVSTACNLMSAFINEVQAQAGKSITLEQAGQLIAAATNIKAVLGCS
jgi:hypothetical protein